VGHGLLDEDVLVRIEGLLDVQNVAVLWGRRHDTVDVRLREHRLEIGVARRLAPLLRHESDSPVPPPLEDVSHRDYLNLG